MAVGDTIVAGMPGRYATALFELALEAKKLDAVERDLTAFGAMLEASPDLRRLVKSPAFSADDQMRALAAVLERARIGGLTLDFLGMVARNRRLYAVTGMIEAFRALLARHRGEVTADVATATKLSEAQTGALKTALKASLGREVRIRARVEPALLGGIVVKVGSHMFDSSLRTKLNNLEVAMKEVG